MAENSTKAFGRYLKTLRERRDLSLDEVASLSQTFPEKINKGYLSRCENGHQKLGFSKVIALSRIYEVPADVLVERMELDLELDRVGGPDTDGMTFAELTDAGKKAMDRGLFFEAYGYLRDSIRRSSRDPISATFADAREQIAVSQMNCATSAHSLGRDRYALHEYLHLESTAAVGPRSVPVILERISCCYRAVGDMSLAQKYADRSIEIAERSTSSEFLGFAYHTRARVAMFRADTETASSFFQKAYESHKKARHRVGCALALNSLAQCHFVRGRYQAARRAAEASCKISQEERRPRSRALSMLLLGEIDEMENRPKKALSRWKAAATIAKRLNDRDLRFKADFMLYRRALREGDEAVCRSIRRRLRKLSPWIPRNARELEVVKRMVGDDSVAAADLVSVLQQLPHLTDN